MCIKIGTRIELSDELKNVGEHYSKKMGDTWNLIMSAHASMVQEQNLFWDIIRKEHPEFSEYDLVYDSGAITAIRRRLKANL